MENSKTTWTYFSAYYYALHFDPLLQTLGQQVHGVNRSRFASVHQHDYSSFYTTHRTCRPADLQMGASHWPRTRLSLHSGHEVTGSIAALLDMGGGASRTSASSSCSTESMILCGSRALHFVPHIQNKKNKDIKIGQKKSEKVENFSVNLLLKTTLHSHLRLTSVLFGVFFFYPCKQKSPFSPFSFNLSQQHKQHV